jgi:hypothetical protein
MLATASTDQNGRNLNLLLISKSRKLRRLDVREMLISRFQYVASTCDDSSLATRLKVCMSELSGRPPEA